MRLVTLLISTLILVGLFMLMFKRLYPESPVPNSNPDVLDTSVPAVNRQAESLQNTRQLYNNTLQEQQEIIQQNQSR